MISDRLPAAGCDLRDRSKMFRFYAVQDNPSFPCHGCQCQDLESNIFCNEWIDYKAMDEDCQRHNKAIDEMERKSKVLNAREKGVQRPSITPGQVSRFPDEGYGHQPNVNGQWSCQDAIPGPEGTCPMPNSRPLPFQCMNKQPCEFQEQGQALVGLTYGHRQCPGAQGLRCRSTQKTDQLVGPGHVDMLDSKRPTGKPYFTNDSEKSCLPSQAPLATPSQFNYEQWLETTENRKPPEHLRSQCIPSACSLCGPRYEECCHNPSSPDSYLLAKQNN